MDGVDWPAAGRVTPLRTCVGCRSRTTKADLLRVVVVEEDGNRCVVPDPRGRLPGRGAYVHPVPECLDLAERRRAFPRAFRLPGPLDTSALRGEIEQRDRRWTPPAAGEENRTPQGTAQPPVSPP